MTIIGLTCGLEGKKARESFVLKKYYLDSLRAFGLEVIFLPAQGGINCQNLLGCVDGLLLTGGGDIHPGFWQEEPKGNLSAYGSCDLARDDFELALAQEAYAMQLPILGICRGMQVLNVALGGSLWQDLAEAENQFRLSHQQAAPANQLWHQVQVTNTQMMDFFAAESFYVNSFHHQGIKALAKPLNSGVFAGDGVVEAIYDFSQSFVLGVQWHPERLTEYHLPSQKVMQGFALAATARAQGEKP